MRVNEFFGARWNGGCVCGGCAVISNLQSLPEGGWGKTPTIGEDLHL